MSMIKKTSTSNGRVNRHKRRGVSLVLVLGLLTMTIALSYTMIRSQATIVRIQSTVTRVGDARQAAYTGMMIAIRKMHEEDWDGVDKAVTGKLDDHTTYEVTLRTGDEALLPNDPKYGEFPFRVTLVSRGRAVDPSNPEVVQAHSIESVMQLVRRKLANTPDNWSELQQYTVYQWSELSAVVQSPVRIEGPTRIQGKLQLCEQYPMDEGVQSLYLTDLEGMRSAGLGDYRPFDGPVLTPHSSITAETLSLLNLNLNVQTIEVESDGHSVLSHPNYVDSYQLYPGGKKYEVPTLQSIFGRAITRKQIGPDQEENPLGIFGSNGPIVFHDDVNFKGTIITYGSQSDMYVTGEHVTIEAPNLPPLAGQAGDLQLPVAIVNDDLQMLYKQKVRLRGFVSVSDDFEIHVGTNDAALDFEGRLVTGELKLGGRWPWFQSKSKWEHLYESFMSSMDDASVDDPTEVPIDEGVIDLTDDGLSGEFDDSEYFEDPAADTVDPFFPQWLEQNEGMKAKPLLTIKPNSTSVRYHWHNWHEPIYQPHPDDEGLRWDLIRWNDSGDASVVKSVHN